MGRLLTSYATLPFKCLELERITAIFKSKNILPNQSQILASVEALKITANPINSASLKELYDILQKCDARTCFKVSLYLLEEDCVLDSFEVAMKVDVSEPNFSDLSMLLHTVAWCYSKLTDKSVLNAGLLRRQLA